MGIKAFLKMPLPVKKKIILRWLLSYLVVLIIPMLVFILVSMEFIKILDREVGYYNTLSINMIRLRMDEVISQVNTVAGEAVSNPIVTALFRARSLRDFSPLRLSEVVRELYRIRIRKDHIENFYIYFPSIDLVINDQTYNNAEGFYQAYLSDSSLECNQWIELIKSSHRSIKLMDFSYKAPRDDKAYILLIRPINFVQRGEMYANIAFMLDRDRLFSLKDQEARHGIIILDRITGDEIYKFSNDIRTEGWEFDSANLMVVVVDSGAATWRYAIVKSKDDYLGKVVLIRRVFIICLVFSFVSGFIFVSLVIQYNWKNFNIAAKTVWEGENPENIFSLVSPHTTNEYQYFSNTISFLKKEKLAMNEKLQYQQLVLRSQVILDLVENPVETKKIIRNDLEFYGIIFQSDVFLVFLVLNDHGDMEHNDAYWTAVVELIQEVFTEYGIKVFPFRLEKYFGFVLNPNKMNEEYIHTAVLASLNKINTAIKEKFVAEVNCSCSNIFYSYLDLKKAFMQALDAMEFKAHKSCEIVFYRDIIEIVKQNNFSYSGEQELNISKELKNGNEEKVLEIMQEVININFNKMISPKTMRYLLFNIAGTIIKTYNAMLEDEKVLDLLPEITMPQIFRQDFEVSIKQIKQEVNNICSVVNLAKQTWGDYSRKDFVLYQITENFVKKYYTNKMLNVSGIANKFKVSVVYLSKNFKKFNGMSLLSYINEARIEHAKILLASNETLTAIAESCGFGSFRTFMRVFKKYEGITPGQFKTMQNRK